MGGERPDPPSTGTGRPLGQATRVDGRRRWERSSGGGLRSRSNDGLAAWPRAFLEAQPALLLWVAPAILAATVAEYVAANSAARSARPERQSPAQRQDGETSRQV